MMAMTGWRHARPRRHGSTERTTSRGQILPLVAISMVALLALLALIIDGGNAWVQQRVTQNGSDSSAVAGASVLAQKLGGSSAASTDSQWDSLVASRIASFGSAHSILT